MRAVPYLPDIPRDMLLYLAGPYSGSGSCGCVCSIGKKRGNGGIVRRKNKKTNNSTQGSIGFLIVCEKVIKNQTARKILSCQ